MKKNIRICVNKAGVGGVAFYRIIQPYMWIAENTDMDVFIYDPLIHSPQRLKDELELADVIVYQMTFGNFIRDIVANNLLRPKDKQKKIVLEYDDYIFKVHPMNQAYRMFGTQEIKLNIHDPLTTQLRIQQLKEMGDKKKYVVHPDGSGTFDLWTDGKDGFDVKRNIERAEGAELDMFGS